MGMAILEINEINSPRYVPSPFGHGELEKKSRSYHDYRVEPS